MRTRKRKAKRIAAALLALSIFAGVFCEAGNVSAQTLLDTGQAMQEALAAVPGAEVIDADYDNDDGVPVYEVELVKGNKRYEITYRASDAKMLSYGWEKMSVSPKRKKALISKSKCKKLAIKEVKGGTILSVARKRDDGIDIYKVKMMTGNKLYTLKYHARTGALIEYEWELRPDM